MNLQQIEELEKLLPSNEAIKRETVVAKREHSGWYEKNNLRNCDPAYREKLSQALKESPAVKEANKIKSQNQQWRQAVSAGIKKWVTSPDYVNPRGMLGKTRSEESRQLSSLALKGKDKPLEGNAKISQARKGRKPQQESIDKMASKLTGRESGRSRKVKTPAGIFNKLSEAAAYYEVAPGSIKNFIRGQKVKEWFKPHLEAKGVKFKGLQPLGFKWLGNKDDELSGRCLVADGLAFCDIKAAAVHFGITTAGVRHRIKTRDSYHYITKKQYARLVARSAD